MEINPLIPLKDFFLKILTVQKSVQSINDNWLANTKITVANHIFTDPINIDIQDDKEQVDFFNKLFGTNDTEIKWSENKSSGCRIIIDENNRDSISKDFLSNIYCQLSVPIFEHFCILLKEFLKTSSSKSINIINEFDVEFRAELIKVDEIKLIKTPTIQILHNLRLFRNCITHNGGSIHELETSLLAFNKQIENDRKFENLKFYGPIKKETFHYIANEKIGFIRLDNVSFIKLLDHYSQLAYLAYICYCKKYNLNDELISQAI
jgi:hypothetical protein